MFRKLRKPLCSAVLVSLHEHRLGLPATLRVSQSYRKPKIKLSFFTIKSGICRWAYPSSSSVRLPPWASAGAERRTRESRWRRRRKRLPGGRVDVVHESWDLERGVEMPRQGEEREADQGSSMLPVCQNASKSSHIYIYIY